MTNNIEELSGGRIINTSLLSNQQISQLKKRGAQVVPASQTKAGKTVCRRCLSEIKTDLFVDQKVYCRNCLNFGKLLTDDKLVITTSDLKFPIQQNPMSWTGQLTDLQQKVSLELLAAYANKSDHLIWAVTGAGKTEIIFPLIEKVIQSGQRIAICSPRIDVCLELHPRIQAAFSQTSIGLFHGKTDQQYFPCQIMVATVHQLVRFEAAFDVLVIDEVDSFPLAGDEMLERAIAKAKKKSGSIVYLSATPPVELLHRVNRGEISISKLHRRFHGHTLPEPYCHLLFKASDFWKINPRLKHRISNIVKNHQRTMIFFPRISALLRFEQKLKRAFPKVSIVSVISKDSQRIEKVQQFRDEQASVILTTTILERGVTFHKITVIVIDADAREFSKTALIQIAGRAGRAKDHPNDEVHFYYQYYTRSIQQACREIKEINRQAFTK
jgi:competence protein ComFA